MKTWQVGGIVMQSPIIVGAGVCKTPASVLPYQDPNLPIGAVVTGSYTPELRPGNEVDGAKVFHWSDKLNSGVNSYGMPNVGFAEAVNQIREIIPVHPLVISIAAFSSQGFIDGIEAFSELSNVSAFELNWGCPNAHDEHKVPISHNAEAVEEILQLIMQYYSLASRKQIPIWIKLAAALSEQDVELLARQHKNLDVSNVPIVDDKSRRAVFEAINQCWKYVSAVVDANTVPNVIIRDGKGNTATTPNAGMAGLSGELLGLVSRTTESRRLLDNRINLIASGGVMNGDTAFKRIKEGATAVQLTSLPFQFGGPKVFPELILGSESLQNYLS